MFSDDSAAMIFRSAKLRLIPGDPIPVRVADVELVIEPLDSVLAERIYPDVYDHAFAEGMPRDEIQQITLTPHLGLQTAAFRLDPALEPALTCDEVRVVRYQAKRVEPKDGVPIIALAVTIQLPLAERQARDFVVTQFGHHVFVASGDRQPSLVAHA